MKHQKQIRLKQIHMFHSVPEHRLSVSVIKSHMRDTLTKEDRVQIGCFFGETKQIITVKICVLLD